MKRFLLAVGNTALCRDSTYAGVAAGANTSFFRPFPFYILFIAIALFTTRTAAGQNDSAPKTDYNKVINERAAKIVNTLAITDANKYQHVLSVIANQYFRLNDLQEHDKAATDALKTKALTTDETKEAAKKQEEEKLLQVKQLHSSFIAHLEEDLTAEQVDKVKDGMTYSVFPITYAAYLDMLPGLTTEQKDKIYDWLKEARELAMDAESSDKKHAVFGKYKGRINNYLSAAGYDMKKEGEEWQKRIKEREAKSKGQGS